MDNYVGHLALMWKCWRDNFSSDILKNGQPTKVTYSSPRKELLIAGGKFIQAKIFYNYNFSNQRQKIYSEKIAIFTWRIPVENVKPLKA